MINRRRFLQAGAAAGAMLAFWPRRAYPFSQSVLGIRKFAVTLPGLGPGNANSLGNYIPVLSPTTMNIGGVATDVYTVTVSQFTQQLHPALPASVRFWGYTSGGQKKYLGGVIVATRGRPVRLQVRNSLPRNALLPVDPTIIDPVVASETGARTDRIAVHLHGGFLFWNADGGPFAWFSNASANNGGFVHGSSFINGANGMATYDYPNDQSARTLWYHDHAYSLTRTNVYAGLATDYLITDSAEMGLIDCGVLPGKGLSVEDGMLGIPLIVQDKTFWDGPTGNDPDYASVVPAGAQRGSLWYPHVYEGGLDPEGLPSMTYTDLPAIPPNHARWGISANPPNPLPPVSTVPEFFSDTLLVNGAPYPTVTVPPRRFRFRFLNAANARFFNLQLYVADSSADGITLASTGELDPNGNPILAPTNRPGPAFIQIANEAGFLPAPALFSHSPTTNLNSNRPMGFKLSSDIISERYDGRHRRADAGRTLQVGGDEILLSVVPGDPTIGNANRYNLLMAPAERPDVIIDFRGFAGQKLILYNDAPAPFPSGDIRNDYYAGDFDLTSIGGAPSTEPGFGPDTRILMQFVVCGSTISEPSFAETVTLLQQHLPVTFANTQPSTDIIPTATFIKSLTEDNEDPVTGFGRLRQMIGDETTDPITYLDAPTEVATVGEVQRWEIYNTTGDTHPMHFHLVNVAVRSRQQWAFNPDGSPVLPLTKVGPVHPPDPNEMGWRETVRMNPGEVTTVDMKFDLPAGTPPADSPRLLASYGIHGAEYVWHCHILEHEEHDMMHALVVVPASK